MTKVAYGSRLIGSAAPDDDVSVARRCRATHRLYDRNPPKTPLGPMAAWCGCPLSVAIAPRTRWRVPTYALRIVHSLQPARALDNNKNCGGRRAAHDAAGRRKSFSRCAQTGLAGS